MIVIFGFVVLVIGLFVPYSEYIEEVGIKIARVGGIIMSTGALLAIEQKIPSVITPKS